MNGQDKEKIREIKEILEKEEIKHIYLNFIDFSGNILTKMVGVKELINNTHVSWWDGISINGKLIEDFKSNENSDWLVLIPDPNSFRIMPFITEKNQKSAMIMCHIKDYSLDTRIILEKATNEFMSKGLCPIAGVQLIYNMVKNEMGHDFYKELATSRSTIFNNELVNNLLEAGIDIEYYMPYGRKHNRIDFVPDIAITSADKLFTAKWFAENISNLLEFKIEFKNMSEKYISSCPIHLSLWKENRGKNVFFEEKNELELSDLGKRFIEGILYFNKFIKATIKATTNDTVKNYKNTYSSERDDSIIQVPLYFKEKLKKDRIGWSKRCIYQGINVDCNYYLVFATLLYAGLYGINEENEISKMIPKLDNYSDDELIVEVENNKYFREKLGIDIINKIKEKLEDM